MALWLQWVKSSVLSESHVFHALGWSNNNINKNVEHLTPLRDKVLA